MSIAAVSYAIALGRLPVLEAARIIGRVSHPDTELDRRTDT